MSEFLLEVYSEEIPARMQKQAAINFHKIFFDFFIKENFKINQDQISCFISSNRISLSVTDINKFQTSESSQKTGPKIDSPQKAIDGFIKAVGAKSKNDLIIIKNAKGQYYAFEQKASKIATTKILAKNIPALLQKMSNLWPKNMRWQSDRNISWVRPIRNILAVFDGEIVDFQFANIKSSNKTYGHNLLSRKELQVTNIDNYQDILRKNFVIFDQKERQNIIVQEIKNICNKRGLDLVENLADENQNLKDAVGLAQFPHVAIANIDEEFMSLPREILILTAKSHQKYFCLQDADGRLAPYFIFVSNVKVTPKIIADNEKVLKARLRDAQFFIDEDLKVDFLERVSDLKKIIFHENLGTIYDKVKRLNVLNKFIALWIPNSNLVLANELANLAKNDLTTKCVAELPELQGVVGSYYAKMQRYNSDVCSAIAQQYLPTGPDSKIPQTPLGCLVSIADKVDTICGLFLVGQKPTSSKDPMALRRSALGIIRIIVDNDLTMPLRIVCEKSINSFSSKIIKAYYPGKNNKDIKLFRSQVVLEVVDFMLERIKFYLKQQKNIRSDIANALCENYLERIQDNKKFDINKLVNKAIFINNFVDDKSNYNIISLYKRAANIVNIEEKKDKKKYEGMPHPMLIKSSYAKLLHKKAKFIAPKVRKAGRAGDYQQIFQLFAELEEPLNKFLENDKVNVDDEYVREARLLILANIRNLFNAVFNFSKIET